MKRSLFAAIQAGVCVACVFAARASQVGPGLYDLPPQPRSAPIVEQDLAAIDAQLAAALAPAQPKPAGTPLGAPSPNARPIQRGTSLINPDVPAASTGHGLGRTMLALTGVILLIVGLSWMYKRAARASGGLTGSLGAGGRAPAGIIEILARYPLASRHTLVVLRFDRRVLLCSMTGGTRSAGAGMTVLCELDEPEDVASVLIKSRDEAGESLARSFERSLRDAERFTQDAGEPEPVRIRRPTPVQPVVVRSGPPSRQQGTGSGGADDSSPLRRGLESIRNGGGRR